MRTGVVLQLFAAAICSLLGVQLWRTDSRSETLVGTAGDAGSARNGRGAAAPASAATQGSRSPTDAAGSRFESATAGAGATPPADRSDPTAAPRSAPPPPRHRPRANPSAIASVPPVVGPAAPHVPEALARVALRFVGKDAAADALWMNSIDDLSLAKEARSDLIEDLNDEGYPDPDHLTAADLPLILERIRIVERLAPNAVDDVNGAAFAEAYKDLLDMLVGLR